MCSVYGDGALASFCQLQRRLRCQAVLASNFPLDNIGCVEKGDVLHGQPPISHKNSAQACALEKTLQHRISATAKHGKQKSTGYEITEAYRRREVSSMERKHHDDIGGKRLHRYSLQPRPSLPCGPVQPSAAETYLFALGSMVF